MIYVELGCKHHEGLYSLVSIEFCDLVMVVSKKLIVPFLLVLM